MPDTLFADVSHFQNVVDDRYKLKGLSFRSNDGSYRDHNFAANLHWAMSAITRKLLAFFIVYFVWEPDGGASVATLKSQLGHVHRPKMAVMMDVESWGGKIRGDHSGSINAAREQVIVWLHSLRPSIQRKTPLINKWYLAQDRKRVIVYANAGDFANLYPSRRDAHVVLANYSANPHFPGKIAHQYSDHVACAPFGHCDMNSADGLTPSQFATVLGLNVFPKPAPKPVVPKPAAPKPKPAAPKPTAPVAPKPKPKPAAPKPAPKPVAPKPHPAPEPKPGKVKTVVKAAQPRYKVKVGDSLAGLAHRWKCSVGAIKRANPKAGHPVGHFDNIWPGDKLRRP